MKRWILIVALALMTAVISYSADEKTKVEPAADSKVYVVYLHSTVERSYVLEGIESVDFKGLKCLKGRHADMTWVKNKVCYVPIDKISLIMEYDSLEKYKQEIQKFREAQLK